MLPNHGRILKCSAAALSALLALCGAAGAANAKPLPAGARYVAMGSSYAAGPGLGAKADSPNTRCDRAADNYAHLFARKRNLKLVDVSCGGATTAHLLGPWNELAPQLDALTTDTALVTVTIGGNDVGYIGRLMASSCGAMTGDQASASPICKVMNRSPSAPASPALAAMLAPPTEAVWQKLAANFDRIAAEVHRRSPRARLVFVDYLTVLPAKGTCAATPLAAKDADLARAVAARLAKLTAEAARKAGAGLIRASAMSLRHDACAAQPWINGFTPPKGVAAFAAYHPTLAGMTAIAEALDRLLRR